jgi:hypothetical protein
MAAFMHVTMNCSSVISVIAAFQPFGIRPEAFAKSNALSLLTASPIFVNSFDTKLCRKTSFTLFEGGVALARVIIGWDGGGDIPQPPTPVAS